MHFIYKSFLKTSIVAISFFSALDSKAQSELPARTFASNHSMAPKSTADTGYINQDQRINSNEHAIASQKSVKERRKLLRYLKELNVPDDFNKYNSHQKFYCQLAGVFAHLELYPLAMKCFLKTQVNNQLAVTDTSEQNPENLAISSQDDSVTNKRIPYLKNAKEFESKKTDNTHIQQVFNDGKTAIAYAMLFHVKQPVRAKQKVFQWANTGHTFITLIKYNIDSTYVSASFGFYPVKNHLLSATPLEPVTSSTFKDDAWHKWDEVLGKFISRRRFEKILALTGDYGSLEYDLNKNNCTDFGIRAASIAGIKITETTGKWPLGCGNNPGVTGQSILQGKFVNTDTSGFNGLFVEKE
jgi:septum formation inhibitor MinC